MKKLLNRKTFQLNLKKNDNQSGLIFSFRFSRILNVLWDRLKANIYSRMFLIYRISLLKLLYSTCIKIRCWITARQTGKNLDSRVKSRHYKLLFELCKKLSKRIGLLKHISPFLKQRQRETYYNGVIKPTFLYGSMIWDSCNVEHLQSILKLQKRAARIILDAERLTPSVVLFNNLNWLPFTKQSLIKRCALVYKRVHNYITPIYLNSLLVRNSEIHNRATRHSNINLVCPKYKRKTEGGLTFTTRIIKDWNCMNANIRKNGSLAGFRHNVFKSFLAEQKAAMLLRL